MAVLPHINQTSVGGIPYFHGVGPPAARALAGLQFRVGTMDEHLTIRGITHLVEHLVAHACGDEHLNFNAFVDHTRTTFFAEGPPARLSQFLNDAARHLHDLPLSRIEHERRVLQIEAQRQHAGVLDILMAIRYGTLGPGLTAYEEFGLRWLDADTVRAWAADWFTAENAAVWSTVPLDGLSMELPEGQRRPPKLPPEMVARLPAKAEGGSPSVCLSGPVRRTTAAAATARHLERRVRRRIRDDHGLSYTVATGYLPITGTTTFFTLFADLLPEQQEEAQQHVLSALQELGETGALAEELEKDHRSVTDVPADQMLPGLLDGAAQAELQGRDRVLDTGWLDELAGLQPRDIAEVIHEFKSRLLILSPAPDALPPVINPLDSTSKPLDGKVIRPRFAPRESPERLQLSPQGLTYVSAQDEPHTVRLDRCTGVLAWEDGSRALYEEDGTRIVVDVKAWRGAQRASQLIDAYAPKPFVPMGDAPFREEGWEGRARMNLWRHRLGRFAALAAVGGLIGGGILIVYLADAPGLIGVLGIIGAVSIVSDRMKERSWTRRTL